MEEINGNIQITRNPLIIILVQNTLIIFSSLYNHVKKCLSLTRAYLSKSVVHFYKNVLKLQHNHIRILKTTAECE